MSSPQTKKKNKKSGRKTFDGKSIKVTLSKLEEVFALGGTDQEACLFAGISPASLYRYEDENPEFRERKQLLKMNPVLKARRTVVDNLDDPKLAFKYLERRRSEEFSSDPRLFEKDQREKKPYQVPKETLELVHRGLKNMGMSSLIDQISED